MKPWKNICERVILELCAVTDKKLTTLRNMNSSDIFQLTYEDFSSRLILLETYRSPIS